MSHARRFRDAVRGRFVTREYAEHNPTTTVGEIPDAERMLKEIQQALTRWRIGQYDDADLMRRHDRLRAWMRISDFADAYGSDFRPRDQGDR